MDASVARHWDNVGPEQFEELLARSNPLREAWSDGEYYYEVVAGKRVNLGFRTIGGACYVPPEGMKKWRSR